MAERAAVVIFIIVMVILVMYGITRAIIELMTMLRFINAGAC